MKAGSREPNATKAPPPLGPVLAVLGVLAYALLIELFTEFHSLQQADSILLSIMSYTNPTMYYWGQDQNLNILPFLCSIVRDPVLNLSAMTALQIAAVLLVPFLVCILLSIEHAALCGSITLLCLTIFNRDYWFEFCYQPYALALAFVVLSLWMLSTARSIPRMAARLLLLLAAALSALIALKGAQPVIILFFVWGFAITFGRGVVLGHRRGWLVDTGKISEQGRDYFSLLLLFGMLVLVFSVFERRYIAAHSISPRTVLMSLDPSTLLKTATEMGHNTVRMYLSNAPAAFAALLLFAAFHLILLRAKRYSALCSSLVYFGMPSLMIIVLMSSLEWVRMNDSLPRYIIPAVFLLALDVGYLAVESLKLAPGFHRWKRRLTVLSTTGAAVIIAAKFHLSPFMPVAERIVEHHRLREPLAQARACDGAIGNYWKVWPLVWTAQAEGSRGFFGVSYRTMDAHRLEEQLEIAGRFRLAGYADDPDVEMMIGQCFSRHPVRKTAAGPISFVEIGSRPRE